MAVNLGVSLILTGSGKKSGGWGGAPASERAVAQISHGMPGVSLLPVAQALTISAIGAKRSNTTPPRRRKRLT
jgi:hypothetical protein